MIFNTSVTPGNFCDNSKNSSNQVYECSTNNSTLFMTSLLDLADSSSDNLLFTLSATLSDQHLPATLSRHQNATYTFKNYRHSECTNINKFSIETGHREEYALEMAQNGHSATFVISREVGDFKSTIWMASHTYAGDAFCFISFMDAGSPLVHTFESVPVDSEYYTRMAPDTYNCTEFFMPNIYDMNLTGTEFSQSNSSHPEFSMFHGTAIEQMYPNFSLWNKVRILLNGNFDNALYEASAYYFDPVENISKFTESSLGLQIIRESNIVVVKILPCILLDYGPTIPIVQYGNCSVG